ncbi:MAG: hypothetical protein RJA35_1284 [Actinomycetota bacterium]
MRLEGDNAVFDMHSMLASVGGVSGLVESAVPSTAFLIIYSVWHAIFWAIVVSAGLALLSVARQIVLKKPLTQAIVGAALIAASAWWALSQKPSLYFLPGILTNAGYFVVVALSVVIRWPIIGLAVGFFKGWGTSWRKNKALLTRFDLITGMWAALFGLRLAIEVPMFLANNLAGLAVAKLIIGYPPYLLCIWFTWLGLRSVILAKP